MHHSKREYSMSTNISISPDDEQIVALEPSLCPNKERCGSCTLSGLEYEEQLTQKLADINDAFLRHKSNEVCKIIHPSPVTSHYRNRMDFVINFEGLMGLRERGKWWKVIDNHHCFISHLAIESAFSKIYDWKSDVWEGEHGLTYFDRKRHHGLLRYAVVRSNKAGELLVSIITSTPSNDSERMLVERAITQLGEVIPEASLLWGINHTVGDTSIADEVFIIQNSGKLTETISGTEYTISPQAFFQTNPYAAEILMKCVAEAIPAIQDKTLLDLYCGTGFFAVHFAKIAKRTIGVEIVAEAIEDARVNAAQNNVGVEFHTAATEDFDWKSFGAEVVIVDPPRSGLHPRALKELQENAPEQLVYVSCGYKNFARELTILKELYEVERMEAVDMFPHTPHVELVTSLRKIKK